MRRFLKTVIFILALILTLCIGWAVNLHRAENNPTLSTQPETAAPVTTVPETTVPETTVPETTVPETTVPETTVPETTMPETTVPETTVPETTMPETTVPETTVPETTVPETTAPSMDSFTLTFVGDCVLGTMPERLNSASSFTGIIKDNYSLPFQNVAQYFSTDDCTFVNLENVFADEGEAEDKMFVFRGPTAYGQILTAGSVELVTLANNHTHDFGEEGYLSTKNVLEGVGVTYVERNSTAIYTTDSGLIVGVYAVYFSLSTKDMQRDIAALRAAGAEVIVAAVHWGEEGKYACNSTQESIGHTLIDGGVDIVWGHHPHVLQKIEYYNGGVIMYSLGNFSFGGNHSPYDYDTALVQQQILRDEDGNIYLGAMNIVPCSLSSVAKRNNFQPTPYSPDSEEYYRVLAKLNGSYQGDDIDMSYRDQYTKPTDPSSPTESADPTEPVE